MQNRSSLLLATLSVLVLAASAGACGGGSGGTTNPALTSGVTSTKTISTINATDVKKICDWMASLYGGYGGQTVCSDASGMTETIDGPASQAECVAEASIIKAGCTTTVARMETCLRSISTCDTADDAAAASDCAALFSCYTTGP
jgi:hypothetical protein